jgi:hypothetical protein
MRRTVSRVLAGFGYEVELLLSSGHYIKVMGRARWSVSVPLRRKSKRVEYNYRFRVLKPLAGVLRIPKLNFQVMRQAMATGPRRWDR